MGICTHDYAFASTDACEEAKAIVRETAIQQGVSATVMSIESLRYREDVLITRYTITRKNESQVSRLITAFRKRGARAAFLTQPEVLPNDRILITIATAERPCVEILCIVTTPLSEAFCEQLRTHSISSSSIVTKEPQQERPAIAETEKAQEREYALPEETATAISSPTDSNNIAVAAEDIPAQEASDKVAPITPTEDGNFTATSTGFAGEIIALKKRLKSELEDSHSKTTSPPAEHEVPVKEEAMLDIGDNATAKAEHEPHQETLEILPDTPVIEVSAQETDSATEIPVEEYDKTTPELTEQTPVPEDKSTQKTVAVAPTRSTSEEKEETTAVLSSEEKEKVSTTKNLVTEMPEDNYPSITNNNVTEPHAAANADMNANAEPFQQVFSGIEDEINKKEPEEEILITTEESIKAETNKPTDIAAPETIDTDTIPLEASESHDTASAEPDSNPDDVEDIPEETDKSHDTTSASAVDFSDPDKTKEEASVSEENIGNKTEDNNKETLTIVPDEIIYEEGEGEETPSPPQDDDISTINEQESIANINAQETSKEASQPKDIQEMKDEKKSETVVTDTLAEEDITIVPVDDNTQQATTPAPAENNLEIERETESEAIIRNDVEPETSTELLLKPQDTIQEQDDIIEGESQTVAEEANTPVLADENQAPETAIISPGTESAQKPLAIPQEDIDELENTEDVEGEGEVEHTDEKNSATTTAEEKGDKADLAETPPETIQDSDITIKNGQENNEVISEEEPAETGQKPALLAIPEENIYTLEQETETPVSVEGEGEPPEIVQDLRPGKIALILDDGGYGGETTARVLELDNRITLSILPDTPCATSTAEKAIKKGFEVMLHVPMQSSENSQIHTFPGELRLDMTKKEIQKHTREFLDQFPDAVGANNHTGGAFTIDEEHTEWFMEVIKEYDIFFVDSRTNWNSCAYDIAKEKQIPCDRRNLFLDNSDDPEEIRAYLLELAKRSRTQGTLIGIGHFRPNTITVLKEELPKLKDINIELVRVSEVVQ